MLISLKFSFKLSGQRVKLFSIGCIGLKCQG